MTGRGQYLVLLAICGALLFAIAGDGLTSGQEISENGRIPESSRETTSRVFVLSPKIATQSDKTHSALLITRQSYSGDYSFKGQIKTVKQIRTGSAPNSWESAWIVWNYIDISRFYYVAIKPDGWEIGKIDSAYQGAQRFIASGETPYKIGAWHDFEIRHKNDSATILLNGVELETIKDGERPYLGGKIGIYTEDAEIQLRNVTAPFVFDFKNMRTQTFRGDGHRIGPWFIPFLGYGFAAISDVSE
jgi:hypothetical protein